MLTVNHLLRDKPPEVWSVGPETTVYDALALMAQKDVGALPVIVNGELIGIVSERDYARKVVLKGLNSQAIPVKSIMTARVLTVDRKQTIEACMAIMSDHHIRHLPVVEEGRVLGMISMRDVVKTIISDHEHTIDQMRNYIMGGAG